MGSPERMHSLRKKVADSLPKKWAQTWENRMRSSALEKESWTGVNDMVAYGVDGNELHFHIHELLTKDWGETRHLLFDGLREIADRLRVARPELVAVSFITGYSPLVRRSENVLQRLGFAITYPDNPEVGLATMNREEFIARFATSEPPEVGQS